jgi:HTH-type transcriptional regulator/antitoxin HigA
LTIKPIRSETDYEQALELASALIGGNDPENVDRLHVLQALIEQWERRRFAVPQSTPAEAIKFRMDQQGLRPRDLIPYLGTKSRVSEVLSGRRQLTVDQIRALNRHLGIPAESLIGATRHEPPAQPSGLPKTAIEKLKAFGVMEANETLDRFLERASRIAPAMAMLRKSRTDRTNAKTDLRALEAWCAGVLLLAQDRDVAPRPRRRLGLSDARRIATLSARPDGPSLAPSELAKLGVVLVVLEHLPGTFLDGAAICRGDGAPVIALTLRHDRIDNFWFTLLHEFAHVSCHLQEGNSVILDDLDVNSSGGVEEEADAFAREALIPSDLWTKRASPEMDLEDVAELAREASVHPAIVAGRWHWEHKDYRRFAKILGRGEVRPNFLQLRDR